LPEEFVSLYDEKEIHYILILKFIKMQELKI